jgi:hypothetical protein
MKYSVWHPATRRYEYYEAAGDTGIHAGAPPRASTSELGATPDQAAWPLPADATKTGSGELPEGRIASTDAGSGGITFTSSTLLYAALGYFLWRMIK